MLTAGNSLNVFGSILLTLHGSVFVTNPTLQFIKIR